MADYVELGDVRTWYDEHGQGEPVLLLHPGAGTPGPGRRASTRWPRTFNVFTLERRGHGRTPDVEGPITY